jgi:hypothetical protein
MEGLGGLITGTSRGSGSWRAELVGTMIVGGLFAAAVLLNRTRAFSFFTAAMASAVCGLGGVSVDGALPSWLSAAVLSMLVSGKGSG